MDKQTKNKTMLLLLAVATAASVYALSRYMDGGGTGEAAEGDSPIDSFHSSISPASLGEGPLDFQDEPNAGSYRGKEFAPIPKRAPITAKSEASSGAVRESSDYSQMKAARAAAAQNKNALNQIKSSLESFVTESGRSQNSVREAANYMERIIRHETNILQAAIKDHSILEKVDTQFPEIGTHRNFLKGADQLKAQASNSLVTSVQELETHTAKLGAAKALIQELRANGKSLTEVANGLQDLELETTGGAQNSFNPDKEWKSQLKIASSEAEDLREILGSLTEENALAANGMNANDEEIFSIVSASESRNPANVSTNLNSEPTIFQNVTMCIRRVSNRNGLLVQ